MNRMALARRTAVVGALLEGNSIRSTCRITRTAKGTVLKLLAEVGAACLAYQSTHLVNLLCKKIQCDEIWSFIGAKERTIASDERGNDRGDCWTWTAVYADTSLYHAGTLALVTLMLPLSSWRI